jgi:ATP adenylyltransferase/5',5'''-P-1,P-4-tetraphosphate phosphorylase II
LNFCVNDEFINTFVTYDFGVASIFQQSQANDDEVLGMIQYVEILKEILQLEYGPMSSPIVLISLQRSEKWE